MQAHLIGFPSSLARWPNNSSLTGDFSDTSKQIFEDILISSFSSHSQQKNGSDLPIQLQLETASCQLSQLQEA